VPGPDIPRHDREEYLDAPTMKIRHHLPDTGQSSWQGVHHVVLVAPVDADIAIHRPNQHAVDSAVTLFHIIEVTVYRVFARNRIVEIAVLDHHLRLDETTLGPLEFRA